MCYYVNKIKLYTTWKISLFTERPHPCPLLIGEGKSKRAGNFFLPKILLIFSPVRGDSERGQRVNYQVIELYIYGSIM